MADPDDGPRALRRRPRRSCVASSIGNPQWDFRAFDYDKDAQLAISKFGPILDVPPTGLDPFFSKGKKLLLSHGWADGLIPAMKTVNFYDALTKSIGAKKAADGVRLFMVPGMGHCAGGDGPVEHRRARRDRRVGGNGQGA